LGADVRLAAGTDLSQYGCKNLFFYFFFCMENKSSWISWVIGVVAVVGLGYLVFTQKPANAPTQPSDQPFDASTTTGMKAEDGTELVIGGIGPLSGDSAAYGVAVQKAMALALEEINTRGGIGGKKAVLKFEDAKCEGAAAAAAVQKLINTDKVQFIIGGFCSSETLGAAPTLNEKKVVAVSPGFSSADLGAKGGDYVFRLYPSDVLAGRVAARYAIDKLGAKKAAILSEDTDYAQGLRKAFADTFIKSTGTVIFDESYASGTVSVAAQVQKIKKANADVVYIIPQTQASGIMIAKALKDQNSGAKILTAETLLGRELVQQNKETLEGVIGFEAYFNEKSSAAAAFADAYKKKYGEDVAFPFFMANAYSGMYLAKELIERQGNDGVKIQQALQTLTNWSGGALSGVTLDSQGDIDWRAFSVKQIKNGEAVTLEVYHF
jgi:branched-chain amino acid transport system substrate-binding protein